MFDNNVLNAFLLLSANDNKGKELNATFETFIAPVQTTDSKHKQLFSSIGSWYSTDHNQRYRGITWKRPCLFGHYCKPSPTPSLKLPSHSSTAA